MRAGRAARASQSPTLLEQVIPRPTGRNGYEELVAAADMIRTSQLWQQAESAAGQGNLEQKRRILRDPPVQRALALLRRGLDKPVVSPRESGDLTTLFPEFARFRSMARLLALRQYVLLADGRRTEAIEALGLGLRFGRTIQSDTLIAGLVGVAIEAISLRPMADHLEQLDAVDCERLYRICEEWLTRPSPLPEVLRGERRYARQSLARLAREGAGFLEDAYEPVLGDGDLDEGAQETRSLIRELRQADRQTAGGLEGVARDAARKLDAVFEQAERELERPPWEREWREPAPDGSLSGRLARLFLLPSFGPLSDRYAQAEALVRLLACHAAVQRYRWEHDRLPDSLSIVGAGDLVRDPFTGTRLQYTILGPARYRLAAAGPPADPDDPDDPRVVDGRRPVVVGTPD